MTMKTSTFRGVSSISRESSSLGLAYAAFAALGLIWGSNFIFVKWAALSISPSQIVLLRVLFGFLPLLVAALATRALHWRHWRHAHHFLMMSLLATTFYYVAFAKGTVLLLSSVAGMLSGDEDRVPDRRLPERIALADRDRSNAWSPPARVGLGGFQPSRQDAGTTAMRK